MKKILTIITLLMILPITAKAATITATCEGTSAGGTTSCVVSISGTKVAGVQANIGISSNAAITSVVKGSSWEGIVSTNKIAYYRSTGISSATVARINVKLNTTATSNATLTLSSIVVSNESGATESLSAKTVSIPLLSQNNNLSSLSLNNGSISFSKTKTSYSVTIDAASTTIAATKEDSTASFVAGFGSRTVNLDYGTNTLYVKVKAASGAVKTYTIIVTRPDHRNSNGNLKSLKVGNEVIDLQKGTTLYYANFDSNIDSITVEATAEYSKASLVQKYGNRNVQLDYGDNEVLIKVQAENQSITTYKVVVNRKDVRNENNNLKTISLSAGKISFSPEYTNYTVSVLYDVTTVKVSAIADNPNAKVEIEELSELQVGNNIIKINVTAENEKTKTYTITIVRLDIGETLPSANIKSIEIAGHKFEFDPKVINYKLRIGNEKSLDIVVTPEVEGTRTYVIGNDEISNNGTIVVLAISSEGEVKYYQITTVRMSSFTIFISFLASIVTICILAVMLLKSRANKNKKHTIKRGAKLYE